MPQIGKLTSNKISMDVARKETMSLDEAGRVGRGISSLGAVIANTGSNLGNHLERIEQSRVSASKNIVLREISLASNKLKTDEMIKRKGADYTGYSKTISDGIDGLIKEKITGLDPATANAVVVEAENQRLIEVARASGEERIKNIEYSLDTSKKSADSLSKYLQANPDSRYAVDEMAKEFENVEKQLATGLYSDAIAESERTRINNLVAASYVEGMKKQGLPGISAIDSLEGKTRAIASIIDGKDPYHSKIFAKLDTGSKELFKQELNLVAKTITERADKQKLDSVNDFSKLLTSIPITDPLAMQELNGIGQVAASISDPVAKREALKQLSISSQVQAVIREAPNKSIGELLEISRDTFPTIGRSAEETALNYEVNEKVDKTIRNYVEERQKHPVDHIAQFVPSAIGNYSEMIDIQKKWGVLEPKLFNSAEAKVKSRALLEGVTPADRSQKLDDFLNSIPPEGREIAIDQLVKDGDLPKAYKAAAWVEPSSLRDSILRNVMDDSLGKLKIPNFNQEKSLSDGVYRLMAPFTESLSQSGNTQVAEALSSAVFLEAKRMAATGEVDPTNSKELADRSFKKLIESNFHIKSVSGNRVIIPASQVKERDLDDFISRYNNEPAEILKQVGFSASRMVLNVDEETAANLAAENSYLRVSSDGAGFNIFYNAPDLLSTPSRSRSGYLTDKDGAPLVIRFKDLQNMGTSQKDMERRITEINSRRKIFPVTPF